MCLLLVLIGSPLSVCFGDGYADAYRLKDSVAHDSFSGSATPDLESGGVLVSGTVLFASDSRSKTLARLNESNEPVWSVYYNKTSRPGSGPDFDFSSYAESPYLVSDFSDQNSVFCGGLYVDGDWQYERAHIAKANPLDLSSAFSFDVELLEGIGSQGGDSMVSLEFVPEQSYSLLTQVPNGVTSARGIPMEVSTLVVDGSGDILFDKAISVETDFDDTNEFDHYFQALPDGTGFLVGMFSGESLSERVLEVDPDTGRMMFVEYRDEKSLYTFMKLNLTGEIVWERSFDLEGEETGHTEYRTIGSLETSIEVLPDGSCIWMYSNEGSGMGHFQGFLRDAKTYIVKIGNDGALQFSQRIDDFYYDDRNDIAFSEDSSAIFISGFVPETEWDSKGAILKIDATSGNIEGGVEIGLPFNTSRIYSLEYNSGTLLGHMEREPGTVVFQFNDELVLQSSSATEEKSVGVRVFSDDELLMSTGDGRAIELYTLDYDFNLVGDGCSFLSPYDLTVEGIDIDAAPVTTIPASRTVTIVDQNSVITDSSVPLATLDIEAVSCEVVNPVILPKLINISTRGEVGAGTNVLIGGFVIEGDEKMKVLIQGVAEELVSVGGSLTLEEVLPDPYLQLVMLDGSVVVNDDWDDEGSELKAQAMVSVGSFSLGVDSKSSAILAELDPGLYSVLLSGVDQGDGKVEGIALIEVYEVP